jgi:hypothetical protein
MTGMMNIPVPYAAYASDLHLLRQGQDPVAELSKVLLVQPLVLRAADGLGVICSTWINMDHPQHGSSSTAHSTAVFFFLPQ